MHSSAITAFVDLKVEPERLAVAKQRLRDNPFAECHQVTGDRDFILKLVSPTIQDLRISLQHLHGLGNICTSIVLETLSEGPSRQQNGEPVMS